MDCSSEWLIVIIGWGFTLVGGGFVFLKWATGQKVQRAEFLERLIHKFKDINYDEFLRSMENPVEVVESTSDNESDEGIKAQDFLVFLSYVCYLKNEGIINDKEFLPFKNYVERTLKLKSIYECLKDFKIEIDSNPYFALIEYARKNNFQAILQACDSGVVNEQVVKVKTISVADNKKYKTHLDVLNGIFNKGLLQHARGISPLDADNDIWFPLICKKGESQPSGWRNEISDDGLEIREYWPDDKGKEKVLNGYKTRYVFAKCYTKKEGVFYVFKGIFKRKSPDLTSGCMVFVRVADCFSVSNNVEER